MDEIFVKYLGSPYTSHTVFKKQCEIYQNKKINEKTGDTNAFKNKQKDIQVISANNQ